MLFNSKSEIFALNYLVNCFNKNIDVPDSKSKWVVFQLLVYIYIYNIFCTKDNINKNKNV